MNEKNCIYIYLPGKRKKKKKLKKLFFYFHFKKFNYCKKMIFSNCKMNSFNLIDMLY